MSIVVEIQDVRKYYDDVHLRQQDRFTHKMNPRIKRLINFIDLKKLATQYRSALEVGCGVGIISESLSKHIPEVVAVDLSTKMIDYANENNPDSKVRYIAGDFNELQLGEFDLVCLFDVVEHILPERRREFLQNVKAHAKKAVYVSIPDPDEILRLRKTRPDALQIVDEPIYDEDFSVFTGIRRKHKSGRYIYYIIEP